MQDRRELLRRVRPFFSASALFPVLVIAVAFGVLAYRSYQLSERMEQGANTLAIQYVSYSADISARRVDAAIREEIGMATESWQKLERKVAHPTSRELQEWVNEKPWITSAIYVPDADPTDSLYVTELSSRANSRGDRLTREFYTASGNIRFTFDSQRLLASVLPGVLGRRPGEVALGKGVNFRQQSQTTLTPTPSRPGLERTSGGFAFTSPLAQPLQSHSLRSAVQTGYLGSGWESQRIISALFTIAALVLAVIGLYLAIRGIRRESETTQLRAALIANVSHELRTPLSMIRLGAETLSHGDKLSEKERSDILNSILREAMHLSHLVENVLDIARLRKSSKPLIFAPVYPDEIVMSVIDNYESWLHSKGFSIDLDLDDLIEEQLWDREAVSRALLNLIDNAVKYSIEQKTIRIALSQRDDLITLAVEDHGAGIPAREVEHIFQPYYRAQFSDTETRRGAGLGLTLVKQIVESHGGRVEVTSAQGRGSTFRMLFPKTTVPEGQSGDLSTTTS
ncbi:MAG TPA: ATP-binding protein [Thermoanaerobaculia bacterium]|nr:ATP-binding protein [Thermoanaerobaculia bacterium]